MLEKNKKWILLSAVFVKVFQEKEAPVNSWGNYDSYQSSEIPRHLISDLHERSYEVLTVPNYHSANQQKWERALDIQRGKKTL